MRVLLTTDTIGGVWTFTRELSLGLLRAGHEVVLASFGRAPSAAQQASVDALQAEYGARFSISAGDEPLEWMDANDLAYGRGAERLLALEDAFRPDILHLNQFCFGCLPSATPRLITAHSDVLSWAQACRPDKLPQSAWLTRYCELVARGLAAADAVTAPTQWMLDALRAHFALPQRTQVIANGRTLPPRAADMAQEPRTLQAVSAGRFWDEAKDLALLERVAPPMPIAVAGEASFGAETRTMANPSIRCLGPLPEDDLLHLFRRSSLYLVTSKYEPFGLAALEAALCGCAVVARDLPSLREVWADAALFFDDAPQLEQLLHALTADPELLARQARLAGLRAHSFSAERTTAAYLSLYAELLHGSAQPASTAEPERRPIDA